MGALFDTVRSSVTARQAAEMYGMEFGRNRRARCPWHDDKRPDLAFYDGRCYCHACHSGGDSVALTAQLYGLTPLEAAQKLNADFRLGADEKSCAPPEGPSRAELRRRLEDWRRKRFSFVCEVERAARERLEKSARAAVASAEDGDAMWAALDLRALRALALAQDELELLHVATEEELQVMRSECDRRISE